MPAPAVHYTEHRALIDASPRTVFGIIEDVTRWPAIFGPTLDVRHREWASRTERFELWAIVAGEARHWRSRRMHDPGAFTIRFEQEDHQPPLALMGGEWRLRRLPPGRTEVILRHDFAVIDNDAATVERVTAGLDINSTAELAAVSRLAESSVPVERLVFSFADSLYVPCATQDAYEFIRRADLWPGRLPHVATVTLREEGDIQYLGMETLTGDGHRHSTRSIRLCSAAQRISYKQVVPPESLLGHSGVWMFTPSDSGTMVTAEHTVAIDAAKAEGPDRASSIQAIRAHVRASLGANSLATLRSIHAANAVGYAGPSAAPWGDRGHA